MHLPTTNEENETELDRNATMHRVFQCSPSLSFHAGVYFSMHGNRYSLMKHVNEDNDRPLGLHFLIRDLSMTPYA